jgi:serine/threonine protein kinase
MGEPTSCARCGTTLTAGARFCASCGTPTGVLDPGDAHQVALLDDVRVSFAGAYNVERTLGVGGASAVFFARDLRRDCEVALKVLRPELALTTSGARFAKEIQITLSLHHPNILPLYESGSLASKVVAGREHVFLATPYVHGTTLSRLLQDKHQLPVEEAVRITACLAEALQYAHEMQVLHRDVKPSNVFLAADGRVLLADFGVARAMQVGEEGAHLTQTGLVVGTPRYMSPEQISAAALDGRSDQYALACVAYEMLAGSPPLSGGSSQDTLLRHLREVPAPVSAARPRVPEHVDKAILRALEKVPADRFPSMRAFADAIRRERPGTRSSVWGPLPPAVEESSCFVIMPFGEGSGIQETYRDVILPTFEELGLRAYRADDIFSHREVIHDIWRAIGAARLVVADVTGRNPNVFYELGLAHAIGKDVIMLAQRREDVPFDVTHLRYILYEYTPRGVNKLREALKRTVQAALAPGEP